MWSCGYLIKIDGKFWWHLELAIFAHGHKDCNSAEFLLRQFEKLKNFKKQFRRKITTLMKSLLRLIWEKPVNIKFVNFLFAQFLDSFNAMAHSSHGISTSGIFLVLFPVANQSRHLIYLFRQQLVDSLSSLYLSLNHFNNPPNRLPSLFGHQGHQKDSLQNHLQKYHQ